MSRNILLQIAFDGTAYSGWQRQKNAPTIQGTLEKALQMMTGTRVTLHGAGRTDAGVHALAMTANFTTRTSIPVAGFVKGLNSILPRDIRITGARDTAADFHSRYNATGKVYRYHLFTGEVQLPTDRLYAGHYPMEPDIGSMRAALEIIAGTHDFSSFEGRGSRDPDTASGMGAVRTLFRAEIECQPQQGETCIFSFCGNGFLRHMVRNIVGTVLEVGSGRISPARVGEILHSRDRSLAGPTAPARGLFLDKVLYSPLA